MKNFNMKNKCFLVLYMLTASVCLLICIWSIIIIVIFGEMSKLMFSVALSYITLALASVIGGMIIGICFQHFYLNKYYYFIMLLVFVFCYIFFIRCDNIFFWKAFFQDLLNVQLPPGGPLS